MTDVHSAGEFYSAFPERRINPFRPEVRMIEGEGGHIVGYASVFNKLSRKLGGFVEKVAPRAFNQSRAQDWPDVVCRYNHSDDWLLGTTKARTCLLQVDGDGLWYDVIPPDSRSGDDVLKLCQRGDVSSSSFAFRVPDGGDSWGLSDFNYPLRTLESVDLVDVAPVITPAYPDATAASRALEGAVESLSRYAQADVAEIRSLLAENMGVKLFKRTDRSSVPAPVVPETDGDDSRSKLTSKERDALPKSSFAYVDDEGVGHFPIHDANHIRNALARIAQGAKYGQQALPKVKAAAKEAGIDADEQNSWALLCAEERDIDLPEWFTATEAEGEEMTERAAAATYEDLETCADCGAKNQYGKHCTNCGKPMAPDSPMNGKHCPNCGSKMDGKRSEHDCEAEERAKTKKAAKPDDDEEAPEDEGDAPEEDAAPPTEEIPEERAEEEAHQPEGTSDNGHKVSTADENRNRLTELLGKRYDPFFFEDSEA